MDAEECRRNAEQFRAVARQLSHHEDRAQMMAIAAYWLERAAKADECQSAQLTKSGARRGAWAAASCGKLRQALTWLTYQSRVGPS